MSVTINEHAKRAEEFSPGWSEAEPWVTVSTENSARFSGRQTRSREVFCRPLKRAQCLLGRESPGLRFACPGLNSSAGYAGSLNDFVFNSGTQTFVRIPPGQLLKEVI